MTNDEIVYTCGFAFDSQGRVLLIRKDRGPSFNIGKFNGLGGKVNPGEGLRSCMSREFAEECRLYIPPEKWYCFHTEKHRAYAEQYKDPRIHFFLTVDAVFDDCRSMESEQIAIFTEDEFANLPDVALAYNLRFLVPMARCWIKNPNRRWIEG